MHLRSVGLFQDYDSWVTTLLPEFLQGQSYCHWPTVEYLVALATGAMAPGTIVTTKDDAVVAPVASESAGSRDAVTGDGTGAAAGSSTRIRAAA